MHDKKNYIPFNPSGGYPAGDEVYYECGVCGEEVPSMPKYATACKCRNIIVDVDAGRVSVRDIAKFHVFTRE
jgi:hypothetical protein